MTSEERAVWIGERLFGLVDMEETLDIHPALTHRYRLNNDSSWTMIAISRFTDWLSSPEGISCVKAAMIEKGYNMLIVKFNKGYWCGFELNGKYPIYIGDGCYSSEQEAVLAAAEKALRAEANNA